MKRETSTVIRVRNSIFSSKIDNFIISILLDEEGTCASYTMFNKHTHTCRLFYKYAVGIKTFKKSLQLVMRI